MPSHPTKPSGPSTSAHVYVDPLRSIWGFHVHQEVPRVELPQALVVQSRCKEYLQQHGVPVDHDDVMDAGYGPHLLPMWELRVESIADRAQVLEKMGLAVAFCAVNRYRQFAYIHPTRHNESAPIVAQLAEEGALNQTQSLWFGGKVEQKQSFFLSPPLDEQGNVVDTRSSRVINATARSELLSSTTSREFAAEHPAQDPLNVVIRGYHIHVDFEAHQSDVSYDVFDHCLAFLQQHSFRPSSTRLYDERENGPHLRRGWEIKYEYRDTSYNTAALGYAIGWLMCNRRGLDVFAHCVTWEEGDIVEELRAHRDCAFFLGEQTPLDLGFFEKMLPTRPAEGMLVEGVDVSGDR